jgi:replicative DNA helicase
MVHLEMTSEEMGIRAMAHTYQVNMSALSRGDGETLKELGGKTAQNPMDDLPIYIDDSTFGLSGILARMAEWKRKHDIGLVILDHIGLVEAPGDSDNVRISKISKALKRAAKRLDVGMMVLSQLNRAMERENRKPQLSDLRDSGSLEQDCDAALFIHADLQSADAKTTLCTMGLLKNRMGRKGWIPAEFEFDGAKQTFKELTERYV